MDINFNGKIALVTGGTDGIGKDIANKIYASGGDVIVTGTRKVCTDKKFTYIQVDFRDTEAITFFLDKIYSIDVDVLINNAGINKINFIEDIEEGSWDGIMDVNLKAPFLITKEVIKGMKKRKYGRIINITSILSEIVFPKRASYCSSKFGLAGLTKVTSTEVSKYNILVNSVGPGVTKTRLTEKILGKKKMSDFAKKVPIGRVANPDDISSLVLYLCSNRNTYVTGQNIMVDGGYTNV